MSVCQPLSADFYENSYQSHSGCKSLLARAYIWPHIINSTNITVYKFLMCKLHYRHKIFGPHMLFDDRFFEKFKTSVVLTILATAR